MRTRKNKTAFTLVEMLVVVTIAGILAGLAVPSVKQVIKSFESSDRLPGMIGAALSNAKAIAAEKQKYAGIRFQRNEAGDQYMVFIIKDEKVGPWIPGNLGFRAIQGKNPIRLPRGGAAMDLQFKTDYTATHPYTTETSLDNTSLTDTFRNNLLQQDNVLRDIQTFSVIFSPAGKLILNTLKVSYATYPLPTGDVGADVFNTDGTAMFTHDENFNPIEGLQIESSRNNFYIINKNDFNSVDPGSRWSDYLQHLEPYYINQFTGELIKGN